MKYDLQRLIGRFVSAKARHAKLDASEASLATVAHVWRVVGKFIADQMASGKGVYFKGWGAFTFLLETSGSDWKGDTFKKTPIFLMHPKFAEEHNVRAGKNVQIASSNSMSIFESRPYVPLVAANPRTIAYIASQEVPTVALAIDGLIMDLIDVIREGHDVALDLGPATFTVTANLAGVAYKESFCQDISRELDSHKPATHQALTFGKYNGNMSAYWNQRNTTYKPAAPSSGADLFRSTFVPSVDRSHLLGVPERSYHKTQQRLGATAQSTGSQN